MFHFTLFHFGSPLKGESSNFVFSAYCGQIWRISSYCLKIHGKNIYGTVDPSSTWIFHFWLMKMKTARLYIYLHYGEIFKKIADLKFEICVNMSNILL